MRPQRSSVVADDLARRIREGTLPAGARLPTHRELAHTYGIALATATKVYRDLAAAGLVVGEPGRGTFVRDRSGFSGLEPRRLPRGSRVADLSFNQPLAAEQNDLLRNALRDLSSEGDLGALLLQPPPEGRERDRAAVATYLLERGIDVAPRDVALTAGAQQGVDAALGAVSAPGTVVAADALTYPGVKMSAAGHHLELAPVRTSADGLDVEHLRWWCAHRPVRVIYLIPTLHNPLGYVLDESSRHRVVDLARRHDLAIIEDGTYAFLEPEAPPPLQTLAPERTLYVGSMSKNLATGLRVGFVVTPPDHRDALIRRLRTGSWGMAPLTAALMRRWLTDGTVLRLEKLRRDDARARQTLARDTLAGLDYRAHPGSYSGWLTLPEDSRADIAARRLAEVGVLVSTADAFSTGGAAPNALRLALATPTLDELADALRRIRQLV
ncbi:aminotransferase-like domain-containing protein [Mycolicibacterium confluentis]|uniref:Putative transcriptional regulator, GntR family protein n=1 Tax=Mycolicibacterium confluentis TaxID=28047 RepID=A0A7I7XRV8_9MYCO|nr:PLP-dependent aminotransferase family protein [Mycolicibacterium confluentis]MCV7318875.1 PLP-dependent aminotransferase family protein [Mycolicibacterium confluentis]ORV23022.1 GntR family transcriptional regulator [Mycolicibacterium confluentis]BBZ32027.1 putative transcriptional regulator, GntR family protein [Mycolicibacterium confluentis]